jgi:hypothetical protein
VILVLVLTCQERHEKDLNPLVGGNKAIGANVKASSTLDPTPSRERMYKTRHHHSSYYVHPILSSYHFIKTRLEKDRWGYLSDVRWLARPTTTTTKRDPTPKHHHPIHTTSSIRGISFPENR